MSNRLFGLPGTQITGTDIVDGSITAVDLASGAVTSAKILDGSIVNGDLSAAVNASLALADTALQSSTLNPIADNAFSVKDNGDATKLFQWELSGLTAGATLTLAPLLAASTVLSIRPMVDATGNIITQNGTSGMVFIGADATIGGSNSGIQYSNATTANRAQIKLHSYAASNSVAGVSTLTSRSGVIGTNTAVVAAQEYSKWTAQAGATTAGSAPISGSWAFKANTVNSLTVTSDWELKLTNLAGTLATAILVGSEGTMAVTGAITGSNLSGTNTGDQLTFKTIAVAGQSDVVADTATDTLTLVGGTGITLTTDASTDTITVTNSSMGGNTFSTIAIAGQSDVVADSTTDTLTLVAGSNITLTTNAGTDTVTIASSASGVADADYGDITVSSSGTVWTIDNAVVTGAKIASGTIDEANLDASVNASLDLADTALQAAAIGTTVQAYDAQLADVAGLAPTDNGVIIGNGANFVVESGATLKTSLGLTIGTDVQAYDPELTVLGAKWISASAAAPASLDFAEDTDSGTNYVRFTAPTTLTGDRTVQLPDFDGTLYISTGTDVAVTDGGTGLSTLTANNVILGNGTSTPLFVAPSTSGNVLTSNGTTWTSAAASGGGAITLLSTQTASASASIIFDSTYITSTYKTYLIEVIDARPATDDDNLQGVVSEDNGSSYATAGSSYHRIVSETDSAGTTSTGASTTSTRMDFTRLGIGNASNEALSCHINMYNPSSTTSHKRFSYMSTFTRADGSTAIAIGSNTYIATVNAINNIKLYYVGGNITSGTFKLYGVS